MPRPILTVLFAAVLAAPLPAQVTREAWHPGTSSIAEAEIIPPAYRGRWGTSVAACRAEDGEQRITILAGGVETDHGGGRLERVTSAGGERSIKLRLAFEGEGEFWDRTEIWTLDEAGDRLMVSDENEVVLHTLLRCGDNSTSSQP